MWYKVNKRLIWTKQVRPKIETPWIYYNSTLGLISLSSDGSNWLTIADKNQWASNVLDYGSPFQWGNNYAFPNSWSVSTSSSTVNTSSYWPNNYYYSSTFRTWDRDWSSPSNPDLWGDITNTNIARKWPCNEWFHVPSGADWESLIVILTSWGLKNAQSLNTYLKFPYAWLRDNRGDVQYTVQWMFYTSSSNWSVNTNFSFLQCSNNERSWIVTDGIRKTYAMYIRPFKNESATPDSSWTVLYQPS